MSGMSLLHSFPESLEAHIATVNVEIPGPVGKILSRPPPAVKTTSWTRSTCQGAWALGIAWAIFVSSALGAIGCGSDSPPAGPSTGSGSGNGTSGNPITVFITNSVYSPNPLTVRAGQYVNFKNNDSIVHSATFDNGTYESGDIPPLSAHDAPVAMITAGTFALHCRMHGEKGSIVVTP